MPQKIEITSGNILRAILIVLALVALFLMREVVFIFFVALVIVSALNPLVTWLQNKKIPRILSVLIIFLLGFSLLGLIIYLLVPPLITQISALASNLPEYLNKLPFDLKADYLQEILKRSGNYLAGVPAGLSSLIVIIIIAFYLLIEERGIQKFLKLLTPYKHQGYVLSLFLRIEKKMGHWLLGQLVSCVIVGVLTFIGLYLLKVPYALVLALAVGVSEIIPFGPVIAFIPAGILGLMQSTLTGILVGVLYLLIQQIEGNLIVPQIMKRAVGLNPVLVILALLIGAKLGGLLGLLIAIPAAAAISVFIKDFIDAKKPIRT